MKQTLLSLFFSRQSGSYIAGLSLLSITSFAQVQPSDSLQADSSQTSSLSRGLSQGIGNIVQFKPKQLNKGFITSTGDLLTGHFAGLRVISGGGQPGAAATFKLNAVYSAFGRNEPLIILDGLPLEDLTTSNYTAFLNSLNPHDIASVTFSKNDVSIAAYGARATNGIYSGQDPEINSGVDDGFYPTPRTFSIGLNLGI